ncbi:hypothetical protein [Butyrivibrio sp. NC3005]|uniref:hypothetical protein n=1 Tax=Butyrivibrio sp. NC3005 TaxID=1280685 RepID=UPI00041F0775|nr:hypothetical protein [Butyrivibrio sp. NC3005]
MCDKVVEALAFNFDNVQKGIGEIMGGQILEYEAKRIAREAAEKARIEAKKEAEEKARKDIKEASIKARKEAEEKAKKDIEKARKDAERMNIVAITNMISFGVPKEKILEKYPKDLYEKAVRNIENQSYELKEN